MSELPSIGARYGNSVSLVARGSSPAKDSDSVVEEVFGQLGSILHVPEDTLNRCTAVGAVCHALALSAVESITDASVAEGIPRDIAASIATQNLRSASSVISGMSVEQLEEALSTPKGITLNAVCQLDREARSAIGETVRSAIKYADNMCFAKMPKRNTHATQKWYGLSMPARSGLLYPFDTGGNFCAFPQYE